MSDFTAFEWCTNPFLYFYKDILQIGIRQRTAVPLAHLYDKHRVYIGIVLLGRVLMPALTLLQPFIHSGFQKHNIIIFFRIIRVSNDDSILEKSWTAHIVWRNHIFLQTDICDVTDQGVKPIWSSADAEDHRHSVHLVFDTVFSVFIPFDKALHNRGVRTGFPFALGTAVRFINDEVQSIWFVLNGIIKGFPNRVQAAVRVLCQLLISADFLRIQEVDMAVLQHFHIEGILCNGNTLAKSQSAGF